MRLATCLLAFAAFATPLMSSAPSAAQQTRTPLPACDGNYNIVRLSDIKPGMFQKFLDAVAAQKAWYQKAGRTDEITVMRIIDLKSGSYSTTQAITTHIEPAGSPIGVTHDAGYDAFVALFRASSDIKTEYFTCMAK